MKSVNTWRSSPVSPRRFINPIFMGGALIFPPERPAWPDADITEVAHELVRQYAVREGGELDVDEWQHLMDVVAAIKVGADPETSATFLV